MSESQLPTDPRTRIPSINALKLLIRDHFLPHELPHAPAVRLARLVADHLRANPEQELTPGWVRGILRPLLEPGPRGVVNATGILLHTNLGRSPLDRGTLAAAADRVADYTDLEIDPRTGKRGHRDRHFAELARLIWDVEDATLVNNAAAGVCLSLAALAGARDTLVSRGELIEIGGNFRLPDIMELAGTRLVEVGATNRTRVSDYRRALGPDSACMLKSHTSNYHIEGFTQSVSLPELTDLGRSHGVRVIMDLGSGLSQMAAFPSIPEPLIEDYLAAGPDVLIFSGDKLLGSIQAGVILGKASAIAKLRVHPMMRMLRMDKLSISILCQHMRAMVLGHTSPLAALAASTAESLRGRAERLQATLADMNPSLCEEDAYIGGGSLPREKRPGMALAFELEAYPDLASWLRKAEPPVIGFSRRKRFFLNLASVLPHQDEVLAKLLQKYSVL